MLQKLYKPIAKQDIKEGGVCEAMASGAVDEEMSGWESGGGGGGMEKGKCR